MLWYITLSARSRHHLLRPKFRRGGESCMYHSPLLRDMRVVTRNPPSSYLFLLLATLREMRNRHARCGIRPQKRRRLPPHSVGVRARAHFRPVEIHHRRSHAGWIVIAGVAAAGTRAGQVPRIRAVCDSTQFDGVRRVRTVVPSHGGVPSRRISAMPPVGAVDPVLSRAPDVHEDAVVVVVVVVVIGGGTGGGGGGAPPPPPPPPPRPAPPAGADLAPPPRPHLAPPRARARTLPSAGSPHRTGRARTAMPRSRRIPPGRSGTWPIRRISPGRRSRDRGSPTPPRSSGNCRRRRSWRDARSCRRGTSWCRRRRRVLGPSSRAGSWSRWSSRMQRTREDERMTR